MMRVPTRELPGAVAQMEAKIGPNETIALCHDWWALDPVSGRALGELTLALTDRALWSFAWRRKRRSLAITGSVPIPLSEILSVTERERSAGLWMDVATKDGHVDTLMTGRTEASIAFVESVRAARNRREQNGGSSVAEDLAALAELKGQGLLSDEDWERAKSLFLGKQPSQREETVSMLRQLHSLQQSGVLSKGEFNMKKWDVLSRA